MFGSQQNLIKEDKNTLSIIEYLCSVSTAKLKNRIAQLCEKYGIRFIETEESYSSKASFLDSDELPKYGEKPERWHESGKRVQRGLYQTAQNQYINCDANIRGRKGSHLPLLPFRTVRETFTSHGSRQLVPCHGYC